MAPQKTPRIPDLSNAHGFPCSVCGGVFVFIIRALFPGASLRFWSFVTSLSRWNYAIVSQISCVLDAQQWHLIYIYIYIYFYYVYTRLLLPKFPESNAMLCLHLSHKDQSDMPEYESDNVFSLQSEQWEHDSGE